mmetsp:Transcript_13647/g.23251  ORF Transcript_13647/g.23251 Transcript_13647/m.23251 type:complete len:240 (+) Transcript_13647:415-1134(+)
MDLDIGGCSVEFHVGLFQATAFLDGVGCLDEAIGRCHRVDTELGHKDVGVLGSRQGRPPDKLRPHQDGLRSGNRSVGVSHLSPRNVTTLQHKLRFGTKKGRPPQTQIRQFTNLHRPNDIGKTMSNSRIDSILGNVSFDSFIVNGGILCRSSSSRSSTRLGGIFRKLAPLRFHLVSRLPRTTDNLPHTSHSLRIARYNRNGTHVVQNIFGGNRFPTNTGLCKRNILLQRLVQMMTHHEHV